ncbi:phosphatase 2C-like domain-containing protein [Pilobolus umbonatus]|nr:phosphatase 2C-like domain-containing protein [Pilobolus umbonatus]
MENIDTELAQLNICEPLRANSSFMKVIAALFHYGNQSMNAAQLVIAVRTLNLLPLRGETPKSTIQGIISTSRKLARDLKIADPFRIDKDGAGRQAKYAIADDIVGGVTIPEKIDIPDEPIILRPVQPHKYSSYTISKRQRKATNFYSPSTKLRTSGKRSRHSKSSKKKTIYADTGSDIEVASDEDYDFNSLNSEEDGNHVEIPEEDTINHYSLLYAPPTSDMDYIDCINFTDYPIASHFAIAQQKGYSYPRFRSHEKIKIPKVNCEDKFRVTDIMNEDTVTGRLFILADGHGGPGCSEYFVRKTPKAVQDLCAKYKSESLETVAVQKEFEREIKGLVQALDEEYLAMKRVELKRSNNQDEMDIEPEHVDNDGCTLILNIFFGDWLINVNVGDSRTVLISAPEPSAASQTSIENANTAGIDNDYKMDVVFASQDHKPYLEHLAKEILENGGEFVDSVQNRVIKVELDKLREDGNRHAKRVALKNARIRPKGYQAGLDMSTGDTTSLGGWATQSAVRTTANTDTTANTSCSAKPLRIREDRIPSLNVARSCGDLDFKMDPLRKIISCEPDVTFIRISDQPYVDRTLLLNGPHKEKRRHFLFMSTDGTFDYMYEETAERQNRAIAKAIGPMIEDGEKIGKYLLEEEERSKGLTIEHGTKDSTAEEGIDKMDVDTQPEPIKSEHIPSEDVQMHDVDSEKTSSKDTEMKEGDIVDKAEEGTVNDIKEVTVNDSKEVTVNDSKEEKVDNTKENAVDITKENGVDITKEDTVNKTKEDPKKEDLPHIPLLHRELTEEEASARKIKERTLVMSARYFTNREGAHGFFASTLQDYDDCTIILVEI